MESQNTQLAESAYELCQAAYKTRDYDLARTYLVNAITHNTELRFLKAFVTIAQKTPYEKRREVVEQAINIFSIALFQVPADEVKEVQRLIAELQEVYDDTFIMGSDVKEEDDSSADTWGDLLEKYSWSSLQRNHELANVAKVREKSGFLQKLIDSSALNESQRKRAEHEFQVCLAYLGYLEKEFVIKESFSELETEFSTGGNVFYIAARLQNATSLLAQMWLLDISEVTPQAKFRSDLSGYAKKIEEYETKYNQLRSKPLYAALTDKVSSALNRIKSDLGKITPRLDFCQKTIREVSESLCELTASEYVKQLQDSLRSLGEEAEKLSRKRFAAYQAFCADKCRSAIKDFEGTHIVSENDAQKYLERWSIAKIDESLLSPEASAIFHEAKEILVGKLSKMDKADFQIRCVTSEKFSLEDF